MISVSSRGRGALVGVVPTLDLLTSFLLVDFSNEVGRRFLNSSARNEIPTRPLDGEGATNEVDGATNSTDSINLDIEIIFRFYKNRK